MSSTVDMRAKDECLARERELIQALVSYGEHWSTCKKYPTNRGGSSYDADSEEHCDCGLNAIKQKHNIRI